MINLNNPTLAVVGHIEWMTFIEADRLPSPGIISHSINHYEAPGGGGAVAAMKISELTKNKVIFITALGNDEYGKRSFEALKASGIDVIAFWRNKPTRKGISIIDSQKERAITIIGERLQPSFKDEIPKDIFKNIDGVFITAADSGLIQLCRQAKVMVGTPRIKLDAINKSNVVFDALIGSKLDPDECMNIQDFNYPPKLQITTEGEKGGIASPGGRFNAIKLTNNLVDTYGCGDSFAAGFTAGLAAGLSQKEALNLGAKCGAECAMHLGAYKNQPTIPI